MVKLAVTMTSVGLVCLTAGASLFALAEEPQQETENRRHAAMRVLTGAGGSHIGLSIEDVESSDEAGSVNEGASVEGVETGGSADDAGFEIDDIVTMFDGERVRSARQLSRLVAETPVGRTVAVAVVRNGERLSLDVRPEEGASWMSSLTERFEGFELPDFTRDRREYAPARPRVLRNYDFNGFDFVSRSRRRLGIEGTDLGSQLADYFGVDEGVLVHSVGEGSVAAGAGLQPGDVITSIDGAAVDSVARLRDQLAEVEPGAVFAISVTRERMSQTFEGQFAAPQRRTIRRRGI
jgi:serine protease Do